MPEKTYTYLACPIVSCSLSVLRRHSWSLLTCSLSEPIECMTSGEALSAINQLIVTGRSRFRSRDTHSERIGVAYPFPPNRCLRCMTHPNVKHSPEVAARSVGLLLSKNSYALIDFSSCLVLFLEVNNTAGKNNWNTAAAATKWEHSELQLDTIIDAKLFPRLGRSGNLLHERTKTIFWVGERWSMSGRKPSKSVIES